MKVAERVLERRLRQAVEIDKMKFGFRPGTGTTHAIFIARQLQERYRGKHRELWWAFVDHEKAFDRVPRKVVEWAMRKLGVEEWLVRAVMAIYKHARTRIRSYGGSVSEWCKCWSTPRFSAESTALHYSNGSSDTQCERGSTMGDAIC